ncbi:MULTISPECIES: glyceraldehyde-3-phosphate dehydrogenase [Bacillus cereus group]|uniref:Glyceraldehyde-3-phosphate dehydrogenase n=2 Tax=Bacillus cereus group TaxID=86661 RepID=A0A2C1DJ68_BACCE|nr:MULTISPECIES: glyceraldehyde-3-phosphate dehydrogenase [Bacillus cereus group]OFD72269.1 glyceraldehyde-3-phosphate dehydrogenase [Bacillus mycoides]OFD72839.1 glyceraldehyde-3-phosphate dehydrogenase [Bacillus mycoides]OFD75737.1 glyceraldehyde-3-phosphate dehydrogenase [Bacillus mycoides]PGT00456.1 glyceraldehyde-3-phosphate dehydrogenase [Bacillus cereus]
MTRVAINGFGRIGRMVFRQAIKESAFEIVAINASYPSETLAHLIKYDTVHGKFDGTVEAFEDHLLVDGKMIRLLNNRDPKELPWKDLGVEVVIEATGKFNAKEKAILHVEAGAKKVILTAPGKNEDVTIVVGVNEDQLDITKHTVISNASCTTNCLAPVVKVLDEQFGIENGLMTTVHAYTNDQKNIDNPHKDLRRARACGQSIIPTTTGAAKALAKVLPHLNGKLHGMALRVPTPNVSLVDLVVDVKRDVTVEDINEAFKNVANGALKGIVEFSDEPLVSIDFNTNTHSAIIDGLSTMVMGERKVKVLAWYDNEWGYSRRVVDLVTLVVDELAKQENVQHI